MRPALDPVGHRIPRTRPTCLLHTWRPHRRRPFALVLHLHQHQSRRNLHLQYLAKNQSTQHCQSLITQGSDHPPVLEPHMVLNKFEARLVDGIFFGYASHSRAYRVLNLETNQPLTRYRHVVSLFLSVQVTMNLARRSFRKRSMNMEMMNMVVWCPRLSMYLLLR
jgi:hypothetical protein